MDRLFLAGLVREIDASVAGARIRTLRFEDDSRALTLSLNKRGAPDELVVHLAPGVAGLYLRDAAAKPRRARPHEAKLEKLLASSTVASVTLAELDRVVTVAVEQTRLSGKTRRVSLVLELTAQRKSVYIVDVDSSTIVDCLSTGTARLATGERYRSLDPPPRASLPAGDVAELERRLDDADRVLDRASLLSATGWTPLLVKEMQVMIETGASPARAFTDVLERLHASRPVLYLDRARPSRVVLSPIALNDLSGETSLEPHPMESFNAAMADAVRISVRAERAARLRQRLASALSRRLKSLATLERKLGSQRRSLAEAGELRQMGETLLAGLARAERVDETHVRLPDPFHPQARPIEIEIDPRLGLPDNAERLFRRSRKAERTELELGRRLEALDQQRSFAEDVRVSLDDARELAELELIRDELEEQGLLTAETGRSRARARSKRLPPRRFATARGNVVLVGRSARSNAELTFRVAKPDDLWLHASGIPGSHVVLKRSGALTADDERAEVRVAAGYAAYFSKARNDTYVDVMVTPRRNVSSIKGAPPGLVRVANAKTVRVRPTPPPAEEAQTG